MKKLSLSMIMGLMVASVAFAGLPQRNRVTDDSQIYEKLTEIDVAKELKVDFDSDIRRLSALEARYGERLPKLDADGRLAGPMKRISAQKYRYVGARKKNAAAQKAIRN